MVETPSPPEIVIHEIEEVDLRSVFMTEHRAFTPWLGRPENLARLARSLGIEIELEAIEANSGTFRTDILARNLADGTMVVIENQFGRSDHDHFGKAMTYLAGHAAKTVVWIAEAFADELRAALTWLNDNTPEDVGFYGVIPRVMRIAGSPPGLRIEVVIGPNTFVKKKKQEERVVDTQIAEIRETFWKLFGAALATDSSLFGVSATLWWAAGIPMDISGGRSRMVRGRPARAGVHPGGPRATGLRCCPRVPQERQVGRTGTPAAGPRRVAAAADRARQHASRSVGNEHGDSRVARTREARR